MAEVERTFQHDYFGDIVTLTLQFDDGSNDEITCTGGHPFWVTSGEALAERPPVAELPAHETAMTPTGRWTEARWLRLGDKFLTRTGKSVTVAGLTIRTERVKVYNLQVEGLHLYAVGEDGVLVHNKPAPNPKDFIWKAARWWKKQGIDPHKAKEKLPKGDLYYNPKTGEWGLKTSWDSPNVEVLGCLKSGLK